MPVIAVINAIIREMFLTSNYGEKTAHQLSTITLIILLGVYIYFVLTKWKTKNFRQSVWAGMLWGFLTIMFETVLAFASDQPLSEILESYDFSEGNLWVFVPIFLLTAPMLYHIIFNKTNNNIYT
jgi:hypothetical protein